MQQEIPCRPCLSTASHDHEPSTSTSASISTTATTSVAMETSEESNWSTDITKQMRNMVSENAVIVIGRRGCCMCHVAKRLLLGLGVNPAVYEVDESDEKTVVEELTRIIREEDEDGSGGGMPVQFPAIFVGGKMFGGLEKVVATHITGELVPILKDAGALWL